MSSYLYHERSDYQPPFPAQPTGIQSTAGAVPIYNDKGELSMQKVKVHRYISGKRPEYAPDSSSGEDSDHEFPFEQKQRPSSPQDVDREALETALQDDPRMRRLRRREMETTEVEERWERHRHVHEPEIIAAGEESLSGDELPSDVAPAPATWGSGVQIPPEEEEEEEEEVDEEEMATRRAMIREKAKQRAEAEEELLGIEEEEAKSEEEISEEEESEYEEYTDSEEEAVPRLKPVFVRKRDRVTIQEKTRQEQKERELEIEARRVAEDRRRHTLKIIEDENRKELATEVRDISDLSATINTDDENEEAEYESWKLRELKRIKRDREEREAHEKEQQEIERLHSMTEEERRAELRMNPRLVTNKAQKGKYKFLQKYYHRGAFFLDEENDVFRRDFAQPTLEDHFDKTILPKVMQVKNFGRSGRTKYTHLVDQDTTQFDSPWVQETAQNVKFQSNQAAGLKQVFERPTVQKRKKAT